MSEIGPGIIPQLRDRILAWLSERGGEPSGPPFMRYHDIDMARELGIELALPITDKLAGDEEVQVSALPAGKYGSLINSGVGNAIAGNAALID